MRRAALLILSAVPAWAHMVSISTGEVRVNGARVHYELRMPGFELTHLADPGRTLLQQVRFRSAGVDGRLVGSVCQTRDSTFVCDADYDFPQAVDALSVECWFASVTVANHVHVLHAQKGSLMDQAVLDLSFPKAELRFRPPTALETGMEAGGAGFLRAIGGVAPLLFVFSLALAARSRKELLGLLGSFVVAETVASFGSRYLPWILSPRFLEAAASLTVAWLAIEVIWLPHASKRWLVVGVLGLFHGMYFSAFLIESSYPALPFLAGVALSEAIAVVAFSGILYGIRRIGNPMLVAKLAASILLVVSLGWFGMRLRG